MVACNLEIFGDYGNIWKHNMETYGNICKHMETYGSSIETEDFSRSAVEEVEHGCPLNYHLALQTRFEAVSGCLGACGWGTHGTGCQRTCFFSLGQIGQFEQNQRSNMIHPVLDHLCHIPSSGPNIPYQQNDHPPRRNSEAGQEGSTWAHKVPGDDRDLAPSSSDSALKVGLQSTSGSSGILKKKEKRKKRR
jgi:hypothetical protein